MTVKAVGIVSPGDMGHSVGGVLINRGMKVFTCLRGRSERTKRLAVMVGIQDTPSYLQLMLNVDVLMSIVAPDQVIKVAAEIVKALKETKKSITYVDCNAAAPATKKKIGEAITKIGSKFVDVGIVGAPPGRNKNTRFYASGPDLEEVKSLTEYGLDIYSIGDEIGLASGLKMTVAALSKGFTAISTELLVAAKQMGIYDVLIDLFHETEAERLTTMERNVLTMVYKAKRWIGEMEEIAKTFSDLGMTPKIYEGAAEIYRLVAKTHLADETPETFSSGRTLVQTIEDIGKEVRK